MHHDFTAFSTTLNDVFPYVDIGYAYFRNYINIGESEFESTYSVSNSRETVASNSIGIRGLDILSLGISFNAMIRG
jgi:hypothetical protein